MIWIASSQQDNGNHTLEKRLWESADQFRANSGLKAREYFGPIFEIIFLRFAEVRSAAQREKVAKAAGSLLVLLGLIALVWLVFFQKE